ncbi:MAG: DNA mismatch repair endonuclease MutL, partial [Oscillospiraceae bacterium]|nr:DNA mismatch repair endonuclease MutL [Oscillospiraceae bacterium]
MTMINRLPPQVADMIAAGEVVERPASVVKELVENSIDAGAKSITVELRRGGMAMLRIADDGAGMSPEDAPTAFLRHATSKLRDERGLEAIGTLGFRGEALAAVASVSRIELTTRRCGASSGVTLSLEGGIDVGGGATPVGCPEGTTIVVRDLFFNTPARLKFMKTDSAESAAAVNAAVRSAMSHPEIAFRVLKDGEEVFRTSGSGDIKDCVYALLGRDTALSLVEIPESGDASAGVRGLISDPTHVRGNRSNQFFFVNNRYVKSQLLQAALEQAYRNLIPSGRFPACVLYLTLRLNAVDVNVHPAKTEIKFLYERAVFDLVHYAVKSRLTARQATATPEPRNATSEPRNATPEPRNATPEPRNATPEPRSTVNEAAHYQVVAELYTRSQAELSSMPIAEHQAEPPVEPPTEPHTIAEPGSLTPPDPGYRIVGEVYGGYIVVELESELL